MPTRRDLARRLPGWIAAGLMIFFTTLWTFWGTAEMFHEGWWGSWVQRLPYLAPIAVTLIPTLIALRWPIVGGAVIVGIGLFAAGFFGSAVAVIGLMVALVGVAFIADGWWKRKSPVGGTEADRPWWRRHLAYLLAIGLPLVVFVGVTAYMLPIVLTRQDDGDRGARLIEGNGVRLVWAPAGPGWNWQQPWGGYPSWQSLALYGVPPVGLEDKPGYGLLGEDAEAAETDAASSNTGAVPYVYATAADMAASNLCRYLGADGMTLLDAPQDVWRMPTTDEVVRSLGRHGQDAGCVWPGGEGVQSDCQTQPDKETPLWAPDLSPVYYWTADDLNERQGYFVAYNGMVNATNKRGGNPRHGYRCVREP